MTPKNQTTIMGKYELLEKLGEGGFSVVHRGRDPLLERMVAIKVLKSDAASSPEFVERFRREARMAASLRHPGIVNVLDIGEYEGRYYLVMDLLPGGTLGNLLEAGKPLPIKRAVELLRPVAEALDYAHGKGMVHRDVKPSNIILNEDDQPVLTDFGLGKILNQENTTTGMALGTVQYMAPEQILGQPPSPATDTYALGVIAFQMLTGQVPFSGNTPFAIQKGHAEQEPPDPGKINPALGPQTVQVLLNSLEKEPKSRYKSGARLVAALAEAAEKEELLYLEELYRQASALMQAWQYPEALKKWESLRASQSDFRDAAQQDADARQRIDLDERYARLVLNMKSLKEAAQEILAIDENYPDAEAVFSQLGLVSVPLVPPVSPDLDHPVPPETKPLPQPSPEPQPGSGEEPLKTSKDNPAGIEWVKIPAGEFLYGESKEKQFIQKPFLIGKYPVTNAQYRLFLKANPKYPIPSDWDDSMRTYPAGKGDHPVVFVSWNDAQAFCKWAGCRLPTELKWEKAARGTNGRIYPWGNDWQPGKYCNSKEANINGTTPVTRYPEGVSPYGVWDMSGNVLEWTNTENSKLFVTQFVMVGGSWANNKEIAQVTNQFWDSPINCDGNTGFRCAREI